ncbi:MAG: hypothetical protein ACETWM_17430 [Candidatus Lokiarchaeia archaeon]
METLTLEKRSVLPDLLELFDSSLQNEELKPVPVDKAGLPSLVEALPVKRERSLVVNGKEVDIPTEVKRRMTVAALKVLAEIYRGLAVFIETGNGWQRLRDSDVIDIEAKPAFQAKEVVPENRPKFRTTPGFRHD